MTDKKVDMEEWRKRPLYKLLYRRLPQYRSESQPKLLDVHEVAKAIGYSHEAVYKWLRNGKMSAKGAKVIVKKSHDKIAVRDLYPFVLS